MSFSIGIKTNETRDINLEFTKEIIEYLKKKGHVCYVDEYIYTSLRSNSLVLLDSDSINDCKFVLVIGGDGTILKSLDYFEKHKKPILGINFGKIGFLALAEKSDWKKYLDEALAGNYTVDNRMMIDCFSENKFLGSALNDVVLVRDNNTISSGTMELKVYVDNRFLAHYSSDGFIISTPTGATAYSLSAGGPIVNPACELIILNPLCAHSFNNASIVISSKEEIKVEILSDNFAVCVDGVNVGLKEKVFTVKKSKREISFIDFDDYNFYEILAKKIKEPSYRRGGLS